MTESAAALRVPAELANLATIRTFVEERGLAHEPDRQELWDLIQAVDEAATNVIVHGYRGEAGLVELDVDCRGDTLVVSLRDRAPVFDPTLVPEPDLDLPLDARPLGGMGVHLIREIVDEMEHRERPGGGNELILVKRLSIPGHAGARTQAQEG